MFTGIITHTGKLAEEQNNRLTFSAPPSFLKKLKKGTSVSVNGACLTILKNPTNRTFLVELMPETTKKTMFKILKKGQVVNLEAPATPNTFLSGHLVQGHVDGVGVIKKMERTGNSLVLTINIPEHLGKYIVKKGSIALNGISLTVVDIKNFFLAVAITRFTLKNTMLNEAKIGDLVNIETDVIAKYVKKFLQK